MRNKRKIGFSLLEILVVLTLILMGALLISGLTRNALSKKESIQCLANIRNSGSALLTYISENNGILKHMYYGSGGGMVWPSQLTHSEFMNLGEIKQMRCPTGPNKDSNGGGHHYGLNMADAHGVLMPVPSAMVYYLNVMTHPDPVNAFFIADSLTRTGNSTARIFPKSNSDGRVHARHTNQASLFFLDGHVESANLERLHELGVQEVFLKNEELVEVTIVP